MLLDEPCGLWQDITLLWGNKAKKNPDFSSEHFLKSKRISCFNMLMDVLAIINRTVLVPQVLKCT